MAEKTSVLRETDDEARRQARRLVRGASYIALAVTDFETGFPAVSRALAATDLDGATVILISSLAAHTQSLMTDPRCSFLAGEPGKGDPLAHPRITVFANAERIERTDMAHERIRRRFLNRHPKSALYIDFPDFAFFKLMPVKASVNGGFGRAFALQALDLLTPVDLTAPDWLNLQKTQTILNQNATDLAKSLGFSITKKCQLIGIDPSGLDFASESVSFRHEFLHPHQNAQSLDEELSQLLHIVQPIHKI
jgi:putative heme iron utilization protein